MTITTVRPSSTVASPAPWAVVGGGGTHHASQADALDTTFSEATAPGNGSALVMELGDVAALAANQRIAQCRFRLRAKAINQTSADLRVRPYDPTANKYGAEDRWTTIPQAFTDLTGAWRGFDPSNAEWTVAVVNRVRESLAHYSSTWAVDVAASYFDVDVRTKPTAAVTAPSGTVATTTQPTVTFTYTDVDGDPPVAAHLCVYSAAEYSAAGFVPGQTPYGSVGVGVGPCTWYKDVNPVAGATTNVPIEVPLVNGTAYRAYVIVGKSFTTGLWFSDWAFSSFTITLTPPTTPTVTSLVYVSAAHEMTFTMTVQAPPGTTTAYTLKVERSDSVDSTKRTLVAALPLTGAYPRSIGFIDRLLPRMRTGAGRTVVYYVTATKTDGSGQLVSSAPGVGVVEVNPDKRWILKTVPADRTPVSSNGGASYTDGFGLSWIDAPIVEAPSVSVLESQGVFRPIGRRGAVVVSSGVHGEDGTWQFVIRGLAEWEAARAFLATTDVIFVTDPFGESKFVRLTARDWSVLASSAKPRRPVTVSYVEVDNPRPAS